jgi:hypothetical protein
MADFEIIERIPQATIIHHVDTDGSLWVTHRRKVIRSSDEGWSRISQFPFSFPRDLFGFFRPTARAFRSDKCNLYRNSQGMLLGIRAGWVFRIVEGRISRLFPINGDCVLHGSLCEDAEGNIYFGEYFMNPERRPVRIWRVNKDLNSWQLSANLEGIRHVHGVYPDPFVKSVFWVTVGDFKGECYFLRTSDGFKTFERFGDGSQVWRAVRLFFTEHYICWLTDSHIEQNTACRMDRHSGALEVGQKIDASSWYGSQTKEGQYLAFTTIERGPAIQTDTSSVLASRDAFHWEKIHGFKKDSWKPVQLFKYGVVSCPSGEMSNESFYLSGEGLVGLDGVSIKARVKWEGG